MVRNVSLLSVAMEKFGWSLGVPSAEYLALIGWNEY